MQAWQSHDLMSSDTRAMDQLQDFLRQRREAREPVANLDAFTQELHRLFVAAEREALGHALSCFDLDVPVVEVDGERHHRVLRCETTYNSAAGRGCGRSLPPAPWASGTRRPDALPALVRPCAAYCSTWVVRLPFAVKAI